MSVQFQANVEEDGVRVVAGERRFLRSSVVPFADWSRLPDRQGAAGRLLQSMVAEGQARPDDDGVVIDHEAAVGLPASIADTLDLPPLANLSVSLSFEGRIEQPDSRFARNGMTTARAASSRYGKAVW